MEGSSLIAERRSEEQHRTCVLEGLAHFYWSISIPVPLTHMCALGVIHGRRSNPADLIKANPSASVTDALHLLHWVFCYSFLQFTGSIRVANTCGTLPTDWHLGGDGHMGMKLCTTCIHLQYLQPSRWGKGAASPIFANVPKESIPNHLALHQGWITQEAISLGVNTMSCVRGNQKFSRGRLPRI